MAMLLMSALGVALVLTTSAETMIAGNFRNRLEARYAAEAAIERSISDLPTVADWNSLLAGVVQSAFVDGPGSGPRTLVDGSRLDLTATVNMASCRKVVDCGVADMDAATNERPWGSNNPRWKLYAYGNLRDLLPTSTIDSPYYVLVMVADDPAENDGNPLQDGTTPCPSGQTSGCNPGSGSLALRGEAFGPHGAHNVIEMTVARTSATGLDGGDDGQGEGNGQGSGPAGVRIVSWREVR